MKKGEIYTGKVLKVGFPNRGIAEIYDEDSAMPLFLRVKDVLPGQTIRARIIKKRAGRPEGSLVEVTERAEYECESQCSVFPDCGGCAYQTVPYEKQLEIKSGMIRELLGSAIGEERFERIYKGIIPSPRRLEYRNKMEFTFGNPVKDGPLTLGMHRRHGFHDILPAGGCLLVDKDVRLIVSFTESFFREKNIPFYHRMNHTGFLRHLLVRKGVGSGEILLDLITTSSDEYKGLIDEWADGIRSLELDGTLTGILHTKNDSPADAVVDQGTDTIFGRNYFYEKILGLNFKITPFSFFQTNTLGAEKLYETAMSMISDINNKTVYDLYCGTGTITSVIAKRAGRAIGVEIVPEAVDAARENAEENKIKNVEFICGDVLKVLDEMPCPPDMIVLDPPRDGVNPRAMKKILSYGVNEILYISCKPTSLARDLPVMIENGYDPSEIRCMDMFPATTGVETICLLTNVVPTH